MAIDQGDEVFGREAAQRRFGEVRVGGEIPLGRGMKIGEIAPAAARDENFFSRLVGVVNQENLASALTRREGTHHACGAGSEYDGVIAVG